MEKELLIMKVWRVPPLGKLEVEVNGKRISRLNDVGHPAVQQRIQTAIGELIDFAGGYQELVNQGFAPRLAATNVTDPELEKAQAQARYLEELQKQFVEEHGHRPDSIKSKEEMLLSAPAEEAEPPLLSLVEEIDAILQRHVQADPQMSGRSIHLYPARTGGLQIEVDGRYYDRPGQIPDQGVQRVIKIALQEWESR